MQLSKLVLAPEEVSMVASATPTKFELKRAIKIECRLHIGKRAKEKKEK